MQCRPSSNFIRLQKCCRIMSWVCRHNGLCSSWQILLNFYHKGHWHRIKVQIDFWDFSHTCFQTRTRVCRGSDIMVVGFTTTNAISANHQSPLTLRVRIPPKICHWLAAGQWFSPFTLVFSTNLTEATLKILFVWHCRPTLSAGG